MSDNLQAKWDNDCQIILEFKLPFRLEDAQAVIEGNLHRAYLLVKYLEREGKVRKIRTNTYETI
ncbi:MAG: hypothetical protein EBR82_67700 [Caulobacteraceae bacterium]|nr:hypothetical protein [Caulobacteraceae bacterium]